MSREKKESAHRTAMREIDIHTHTWQESSAVIHEKKTNERIDSILWQREKENEKKRKTAQVSIR